MQASQTPSTETTATEHLPISRSRQTFIITRAKGSVSPCGDYDNDGRIDIYVANDTTPNFLYRNVGDGRFVDIGPFGRRGV